MYFNILDRSAVNYAKWQLLLGEYSHYKFAVAAESFDLDILHKVRYPLLPERDASVDLTCVTRVESSMRFAVARPFVEEYITKGLINTVSLLCSCTKAL